MPVVIKKGDIEEVYEEREIEWRIFDFFSIPDSKVIESPTFCFADSSWNFRLVPKSRFKPGFGIFGMCNKKPCDYFVKYNVGYRKLDGSVEQLSEGIFERYKYEFFYKLTEELEQKCEMPSSNMITITCTLKRESTRPDRPNVLYKQKLKKLIKLDTLSENFKDLIANKGSCDTTLHVQDKEYKAHRAVLIARSPVFAAMFLHDTSEKQTGVVTIPDCDPETFGEFLKFLYCGKLEEPSSICALHLYETSEKYEVVELKTFCAEYLKENLTVENVCDIVILADKHEETNLLNAAQDYFNKNANKVIETSAWDRLWKNDYNLTKILLRDMTSKLTVVD